MQERAADVADVGQRVLRHLTVPTVLDLPHQPFWLRCLTPDTAQLDPTKCWASALGSATSTARFWRARYPSGSWRRIRGIELDQWHLLGLDGEGGRWVRARYCTLQAKQDTRIAASKRTTAPHPAVTRDGRQVTSRQYWWDS